MAREAAGLAVGTVRPGGSVLFLGRDDRIDGSVSEGFRAITSSLALELAPIRVNLLVADPAGLAEAAVNLMADPSITGAISILEERGAA